MAVAAASDVAQCSVLAESRSVSFIFATGRPLVRRQRIPATAVLLSVLLVQPGRRRCHLPHSVVHPARRGSGETDRVRNERPPRIKSAIIGFGRLAQIYYTPALHRLAIAEVVAVADPLAAV